MMISFSFLSTFQARLPVGNDQTSLLHLIIRIRDRLECITEFDLTSVYVRPDSAGMNDLMKDLQSSSTTTNPIVRLLASGNQNTVGQLISSISQQFNQKNNENLYNAISSKERIELDLIVKRTYSRWDTGCEYFNFTTWKSTNTNCK